MPERTERKESLTNTKGGFESRSLAKLNERARKGLLALLLLLPVGAGAGGVVTNCTEAALRAAMAGGRTVTFACDGTITLASTIAISLDTVLDASGRQVTISGWLQMFYVSTNVNFTLINLTLAGGHCDTTGAAIYNHGGTVNLINVALAGNTAEGTMGVQGGAIRNELGTLNLQNCSFTGNSVMGEMAVGYEPSPALGGAIYNNGTMRASACTFSNSLAMNYTPPNSGWGYSGGPAARHYRSWQTGAPGVIPSLDLHMVPAITLTGSIGNSVRVDCINRFGPIDAWVTLATVTLTNTSQLYFDVTAPGQPERLYRPVQVR